VAFLCDTRNHSCKLPWPLPTKRYLRPDTTTPDMVPGVCSTRWDACMDLRRCELLKGELHTQVQQCRGMHYTLVRDMLQKSPRPLQTKATCVSITSRTFVAPRFVLRGIASHDCPIATSGCVVMTGPIPASTGLKPNPGAKSLENDINGYQAAPDRMS
jgi:hypothetical protein